MCCTVSASCSCSGRKQQLKVTHILKSHWTQSKKSVCAAKERSKVNQPLPNAATKSNKIHVKYLSKKTFCFSCCHFKDINKTVSRGHQRSSEVNPIGSATFVLLLLWSYWWWPLLTFKLIAAQTFTTRRSKPEPEPEPAALWSSFPSKSWKSKSRKLFLSLISSHFKLRSFINFLLIFP